jgi:hypothetical protein
MIPWESLSNTFKDAIRTTRALGIPHLWIDSLCIVQDDDDEWDREAAKMGTIYSQAVVNIAAPTGFDGSGGCFLPRPRLDRQVKLRYPPADGKSAESVLVGPSLKGFRESVLNGPLLQRGWVIQEMLLARRILYYADDQLYWQCFHDNKSESGDAESAYDFRIYVAKRLAFEKISDLEDPYIMWTRLVQNYTRCSLTRGDDKLHSHS